jgi:hypothetical protein
MSAICVEKKGYLRMKLLVPSMGSMSQRYSASAPLRPVSSPRKSCVGKALISTALIASSACSSASVTGEPSALMRTSSCA